MTNYQNMLQLAMRHKYESFTELQDEAFCREDVYDDEKNLFIIGATSSGKTLIPQLIYEDSLQQAKMSGKEYPKMLFVVPYRALAAQKVEEMRSFYQDYSLQIVQSTGEFRQDDSAVQSGEVDIGVIINEKVYKYAARDPEFLSKYDYLVLDEVGLINDSERGIRIDFIFSWATAQNAYIGRPRIIALGTPFFDWSAYVSSYNFSQIRCDQRPGQLNEVVVTFADQGSGIKAIDGMCTFLYTTRWIKDSSWKNLQRNYLVPGSVCEYLNGERCPFETPCRSNSEVMCDVIKRSCPNRVHFAAAGEPGVFRSTILKICREHIRQGHQVLVFINNREEVKNLSMFLYHELKEDLCPAPPVEECRNAILSPYGLESDDVYGILEHEDGKAIEAEFYQAFVSGIGFHNAAMPNELRSYVEEKFLESREMKIVCSTETLAFGVNSSVDVVVIADMYKHEIEGPRALSLNEYRNYVGRAGRLHTGKSSADIKGYVYTLVKHKQIKAWKAMKAQEGKPEQLHSLFHADYGQKMPFFVLNMLPVSSEDGMTQADIFDTVCRLPMDQKFAYEGLREKIAESLDYLKQQGLAKGFRPRVLGRRAVESGYVDNRYYLTGLGKNLRGFIIGLEDYDCLQKALEECLAGIFTDMDKTTFLYRLLCTKHAESGLNSIFANSETRMDVSKMREYIINHTQDSEFQPWQGADENKTTVLAAMLAWTEGESPKTIYRQFGVHYALISKLADQIAYLIEIAQAILPSRMEKIMIDKAEIYSRMGSSPELIESAMNEKAEEFHCLFCSVSYGVNAAITSQLLEYLAGIDDPVANSLREELSLYRIDPMSARKLRRIGIRYKFFENPPEVEQNNLEMYNNLKDQRRRYQMDLKDMGPYISGFFESRFGKMYTD